MAQLISSAWRVGSGCASHLRGHLERLVNGFPEKYRETLESGEQFPSLQEAEQRLTCFALINGFQFVRSGGNNSTFPGRNYRCVHHGKETLNTRKLEDPWHLRFPYKLHTKQR